MGPDAELTALTTLLQDIAVQLQQAARYHAVGVVAASNRWEQQPTYGLVQICAACGLPIAWDQPYLWIANSPMFHPCHRDFASCVEAAEALCTMAFETIRYGNTLHLRER